MFQLLENPILEPQFRCNLVIATQRLAINTNLYPKCAALEDVGLDDDHPVATDKFSHVYKGHLKNKRVRVRVMKVYITSKDSVEYVMKVCFYTNISQSLG